MEDQRGEGFWLKPHSLPRGLTGAKGLVEDVGAAFMRHQQISDTDDAGRPWGEIDALGPSLARPNAAGWRVFILSERLQPTGLGNLQTQDRMMGLWERRAERVGDSLVPSASAYCAPGI